MELLNNALSIRIINRMTITKYPQLTLIERDGYREKYIGYNQKESIMLFRKKYPARRK
jgi:hypothetical protein